MEVNSNLNQHVKNLDWECADLDTQYLTHSIHRYSGKFIPQIARQAIMLLSKPGDWVLDPYCGSGTTLLESALADRNSLGIDLNPLAVLIASAKTTTIDKNSVDKFVNDVIEKLSPVHSNQGMFPLFNSVTTRHNLLNLAHQDPRWENEWFKKWFKLPILEELIIINRIILAEQELVLRNLGLVAFSDIIRRCSNANSSYPNVMFDKNRGDQPPAIPIFIERLKQIARLVKDTQDSLVGKPIPIVIHGNSRTMPLQSESIDAVITHPPYIASIPYAEYGSLSLGWLGYDPKDLDKKLTGGQRHSKKVVDKFIIGYKDMVRECWRVLKPKGNMFLLVGNPTVDGEKIDLISISQAITTETGFSISAMHYRNGINRRANLMGKEGLLFLTKA